MPAIPRSIYVSALLLIGACAHAPRYHYHHNTRGGAQRLPIAQRVDARSSTPPTAAER